MVSYMWGKDVADALRVEPRGREKFICVTMPLRMPVEFKPIDKPQNPR